jgi:hypothetical protein
VVTGSAGLTFTDISIIPAVGEKVCFAVDLTVGGTYHISLETDAEVPFNFSGEIAPYVPLDLNELTYSVSPDCGNGSGQVVFQSGVGQVVQVDGHFPPFGTPFNNFISDLDTGLYAVFLSDIYCNIDTLILNIEIPDGSLSHDVTEIVPIRTCGHDSLEVDGLVTGGFYGDITGGSGLYDVNYITSGGEPVIGPGFGYEGISESGFYNVFVIDEETGCEYDFDVEVPLEEVEVDISVLSITPLVVNTAIVLQEGEIEVEAEYNGGPAVFDYEWSPTGGSNGNTATYSELTAPGIYTVVATLAGETCSIELDVELIENACNIPADFNHDGIINSTDQLIFIGAYGTFCSGCPQDLNFDGVVNIIDLTIFLVNFGITWDVYCGY